MSKGTAPRPPSRRLEPRFSAAPPPDGWDASRQSTDVRGLEELRAAGQIVRDGWFRADGGALVLRVAAWDVDAVEKELATQLPRRLCVVRSRYSAAHLHEVEDTLDARHAEWGFEAWSCRGLDALGQPYADAALTRVSDSLAAWADALPDGLLALHPAMTPP
jgi:hypothetical protein